MLTVLFSAFIAGLLLTFTPCVLPMIPILSSIIAGQGENISKTKGVVLALSYVMGTAVTYALMGALAGATGEQLQSYFQNVWFIGFMSLVFVGMALSMFGAYNIQMPSFIQSRLDKSSNGIKGGSISMVFILGMVSALILGACVSPVLISFLGVAISTGDSVLGALTMFSMALGMGVPLVLLGFGAGHILPKVGGWMDNVKYFFGFMLLAVAVYLFNTLGLFSPLLLWGALLIVIALQLNLFQRQKDEATALEKFVKSLALLSLIWGTILLVGGAYGEESFIKPLPKTSVNYVQNTNVQKDEFPFQTVKSMYDLKAIQKEAIENEKLMIIYFYTDICPVCKHLKATTLIDPEVKKALKKDFVALKVNMTDRSDQDSQAIKKHFKVFGPPTFVVFDRDGEELEEDRFSGYQEPGDFFDILDLLGE